MNLASPEHTDENASRGHELMARLLVNTFSVFLVLVSADSYQPFEDFDKCHIADEECPNSNITFWLYTRDTMDNPMQLDMTNTEAMSRAVLGKSKRVFVLLHGYTGYKDFSPNPEIRPEIMRHGDHSVISVDYKPLAPEPCYIQAVHNLPLVANCTAQLLDYMMSQSMFSLKDLHIIGFSLGAQTAGMIGTFVKTGKLLRITGLDPAKPLFTFAPAEYKLTKDKAVFVDVLHTDILARGVLRAAGHADFYVNGGIEQPGCSFQRNTSGFESHRNAFANHFLKSVHSQALDRVIIRVRRSIMPNRLIRLSASGASNATSGKTGRSACARRPPQKNWRSWAGKPRTSKFRQIFWLAVGFCIRLEFMKFDPNRGDR